MDTPAESSVSPLQIFGVPIHTMKREEIVRMCRQWLTDESQRHIVTANPEILLHARSDGDFRAILQKADLVTADGIGIRWAGAFLYATGEQNDHSGRIIRDFFRTLAAFARDPHHAPSPVPERVSGADLLWDLCREAAARGQSVYLLGGRDHTAMRAAIHLRSMIPSLKVQAYEQDHSAREDIPHSLQRDLETAALTILFVGYGAPLQEQWIWKNLSRYPNIRIAIGVGGVLNVLAGNTPEAPRWYQDRGLEWLWRLLCQPSRIVRILRATIVFPTMLLFSRLRAHPHGTSIP